MGWHWIPESRYRATLSTCWPRCSELDIWSCDIEQCVKLYGLARVGELFVVWLSLTQEGVWLNIAFHLGLDSVVVVVVEALCHPSQV